MDRPEPGRGGHLGYDVGRLNFYLIAVAAVGGLTALHLSAYDDYLVPRDGLESEKPVERCVIATGTHSR